MQTTKRLLSLDVFRGLTIAGMILVNSPGNNTAYPLLEHAEWNGCTPTDLIFPFFLFIVGVSVVFAFTTTRARSEATANCGWKILKRTAIIFLIGLFLNGFPHYHLAEIRYLGVLQRIALCYFAAAILYLTTTARTQFIILLGLLIGYWLLIMHGVTAGDLTPDGNLAAVIDRSVLAGHTYRPTFDPEGLLSTLPAIATVLLGNLTGIVLQQYQSPEHVLKQLLCASMVCLVMGAAWSLIFPLNKTVWTSSFVLWTGGLALLLFSMCYYLIDIKQYRAWSKPFEIFGTNALLAYILHILFLKLQHLVIIHQADGTTTNLRLYLTAHLFGWAPPELASLCYAITYVLLWLGVLSVFYRRRIFVKI